MEPPTINQLANPNQHASARMGIADIAQRLGIGRVAVYRMLEAKIIPAVRVGKRWVITRKAFEKWEESCGQSPTAPTIEHHGRP